MTSTTESTIVDLEERRLAAMVAADTDALDGILADDLSYVHTSAAIDTKESLTSGLATGRLNYESITPHHRPRRPSPRRRRHRARAGARPRQRDALHPRVHRRLRQAHRRLADDLVARDAVAGVGVLG